MLVVAPDDFMASLQFAGGPCPEDCCEDVGVVGDVALAAAEVAEEAPAEIDPLAVCVDAGVEYGDGAPGLCPGRGDAARD